MKKHKKKKIALAFIIVTFGAFGYFDYYMRTSWDDHIVTRTPERFHIRDGDGVRKGENLDEEGIKALPEKYKVLSQSLTGFKKNQLKFTKHIDQNLTSAEQFYRLAFV